MSWTNELPTTPGHYWVEYSNGKRDVIHVENRNGEIGCAHWRWEFVNVRSLDPKPVRFSTAIPFPEEVRNE